MKKQVFFFLVVLSASPLALAQERSFSKEGAKTLVETKTIPSRVITKRVNYDALLRRKALLEKQLDEVLSLIAEAEKLGIIAEEESGEGVRP